MNPSIAAADQRLAAAFLERNYRLRELSGVIDSVGVDDATGRYLFAWHRYAGHLLFYLRGEALKSKSTLRLKALHHHGDQVHRNNAGETTITLRNEEEADVLLRWLLPTLPLPIAL